MKKILNLNSFFTKIILAVLSFLVIICLFVPCAQIPAVEAVQDVDVENKIIKRKVGKEVPTVNFISDFCAGQPYLLYKDEALTQTVNVEAVPTPNAKNVYYMQLFLKGYEANSEKDALDFIPIATYTVNLNKATDGSTKTTLLSNVLTKTIEITVPDSDTFDFTRVVDSRKAWAKYSSAISSSLDASTRTDGGQYEVTSIKVTAGVTEPIMYVAFSVKSETNPFDKESTGVYYPLEMYTFELSCDGTSKTLPTVGEMGLGIKSAEATKNNDGVMKVYTGDAFMFIFMIAAGISTLFAFVIPNKFKFIEGFIAVVLGAGLIVVPILDNAMFYSKYSFELKIGWYILIVLGVLIVLAGLFDTFRCMKEYKDEQERIYGKN